MDRYKVRHGCSHCGYNDHPFALEFDHIDPHTKSMAISDMYCFSWERIKPELAKCQILCGNCHNIKTITARRNRRRG